MKKFIAFLISIVPVSAFAQISGTIDNLDQVAKRATSIGDTIIILLISFSVIWIVVNVVRYLIAGGEDQRKEGGKAILYGVIGLFVILSIWGLVNILKRSFKTDDAVPTQFFPKTIDPENPNRVNR